MATDTEFETAQASGQVHTFMPLTRNGMEVTGRVIGRGTAVVTTAAGGATQPWEIEDVRGNRHQIAGEDYDIK